MDYLALALFIVLFACADWLIGSHTVFNLSTLQETQLAILASFLFGVIAAWRKNA